MKIIPILMLAVILFELCACGLKERTEPDPEGSAETLREWRALALDASEQPQQEEFLQSAKESPSQPPEESLTEVLPEISDSARQYQTPAQPAQKKPEYSTLPSAPESSTSSDPGTSLKKPVPEGPDPGTLFR